MATELVKKELENLAKVVELADQMVDLLARAYLEIPDGLGFDIQTTDGEKLGRIGWGECGNICFIAEDGKDGV